MQITQRAIDKNNERTIIDSKSKRMEIFHEVLENNMRNGYIPGNRWRQLGQVYNMCSKINNRVNYDNLKNILNS